MGKRGTVVVPMKLRQRLGLKEGTLLIVEEQSGGILLRPAIAMATELYSDERKAEFLLNNAVDAKDYARAVRQVRALGLDPKKISHRRP